MTDNDFYGLIMKALTLVVLVTIVLSTSCEMHKNYLKSESLKAGATPVGVSCAYDSSQDCATSAAQGKQ